MCRARRRCRALRGSVRGGQADDDAACEAEHAGLEALTAYGGLSGDE